MTTTHRSKLKLDYDKPNIIEKTNLFLDPENDAGPVEYKYTLQDGNSLIYQARASQLHYRLQEGNGLAILYLGVTDNGYQLGLTSDCLELSLDHLMKILELVDGKITNTELSKNQQPIESCFKQLYLSYNTPISLINPGPTINTTDITDADDAINTGPDDNDKYFTTKELSVGWTIRPIPDNPVLEKPRYVLRLEISRQIQVNRETRIVVIGSVDSGKSSLVGVLTSNKLDNGRGSARSIVCNHRHEIESGRTSSIGQRLLGLDHHGKILNSLRTSSDELIEKSSRLVSLIDLAGHLKYLNTTVRGVCGHFPDHALIIIDAAKTNAITPMTKEHIALGYLQRIPMSIIFTKIDKAEETVYKKNHNTIKTLLKSINYNVLHIKTEQDLDFYHKQYCLELVPLFTISNVQGTNLELLTRHLHQVPSNSDFAKKILEPFHASINETFTVTGVGTVISTIVLSGTAEARQVHWLGPFHDGSFRKVTVKSIQYKRTNVAKCISGQAVTFALRGIERQEILKGMVLLDGKQPEPRGTKKYIAEITIVGRHSTSIKEFYEPVINIDNVRQVARITKITNIKSKLGSTTQDQSPIVVSKSTKEDEITQPFSVRPIDTSSTCLRSGDTATIEFEFKYHPVYLREGGLMMFREQKVKGYGVLKSHEISTTT